MKRKSGRAKKIETSNGSTSRVEDEPDETQNEEPVPKKDRKSKGKKGKQDQVPEIEETDPLANNGEKEDSGSEASAAYEVEAIVDDKIMRGVKYFKIRWKGYNEESDTWEPEADLECDALLKDYKDKAKQKKPAKKHKNKKNKNDEPTEEWDENEDFEVDRIIDVYFHKNGKRDFLVSWKGYPATQNSWEPEDHMNCKDLIAKYMEKVTKARQFDAKETKLRVNPRQVERLEFNMHAHARKLSKRNRGGQRVHYYDAE